MEIEILIRNIMRPVTCRPDLSGEFVEAKKIGDVRFGCAAG